VVIVMCFATASVPRSLPPSPGYDWVEMIASGSLKMRDSVSPTRKPPRAMQTIWLKRQPESRTVTARRSIAVW